MNTSNARCPKCNDRGFVTEPLGVTYSNGDQGDMQLWAPCPEKCPASELWLERGGS